MPSSPRQSKPSTRRKPRPSEPLPILPVSVGAVFAAVLVAIVILAARAGGGTAYAAIDGIKCQANEQLVYHIHAHLAIYDAAGQVMVPEAIGIGHPLTVQATSSGPYVSAGSCFYWLHTHDSSGVIHIESPTKKLYTLGQFFDVWGQKLGPDQVGSQHGKVVAYVNGSKYSGNPRDIQLTAHEVIQLDIGSKEPPQPFTFPAGL